MNNEQLSQGRHRKQVAYHVPRELEYPLHSIRDIKASVLVWVQPHLMRAAYELWAEDRVIATLRFKSFAHRKALAASADGLWTIEDFGDAHGGIRLSQWNRPVGRLVRRADITDVLTLDHGRTFYWMRRHAFKNENSFVDLIGRDVIQFSPEKSMTARARVQLPKYANILPEISLLALLGLYLTLHGISRYDRSKQIGT